MFNPNKPNLNFSRPLVPESDPAASIPKVTRPVVKDVVQLSPNNPNSDLSTGMFITVIMGIRAIRVIRVISAIKVIRAIRVIRAIYYR